MHYFSNCSQKTVRANLRWLWLSAAHFHKAFNPRAFPLFCSTSSDMQHVLPVSCAKNIPLKQRSSHAISNTWKTDVQNNCYVWARCAEMFCGGIKAGMILCHDWVQRRSVLHIAYAHLHKKHPAKSISYHHGNDQSCWKTKTKKLLSLSLYLVEETRRWMYRLLRSRQITLTKCKEVLHTLVPLSPHHPAPASLLASPC